MKNKVSFTKQILANGEVIATVEGTGGSAIIHYAHTDHLGGTNVVTNAAGTLEKVLDYYPFGTIRTDYDTTEYDPRRKFTGHEYDEGTGLYYMQQRYQNPEFGRFVSQDPLFVNIGSHKSSMANLRRIVIDPQRMNSYAYAGDNPLRNIDPDGKDYWEINASINVNPFSYNFGVKVDFENLRMDATGGAGVSAGGSAGLFLEYHEEDLPNDNHYDTYSADVTAGLLVVGKYTASYTVNQSTNNVTPNGGGNLMIGTGGGYAISGTVNKNITVVDYSSARNSVATVSKSAVSKLLNVLKKVGVITKKTADTALRKINSSSSSNSKNNKKKNGK